MTQSTQASQSATVYDLPAFRRKRNAAAAPIDPQPSPKVDGYAGSTTPSSDGRWRLGIQHAIYGAIPGVGVCTNGFMTLGAALSFTSSDPNLGRAGRIALAGLAANLTGTVALVATHSPAALLPLALAGALEVAARLQLPTD